MQTETAAQSKASCLSFFSVLTKLDLAGVCLCAPSGSLFQISVCEITIANPDFCPQWRRSSDVNPRDKLAGLYFTSSLPADQMHPDNKLTNHGKEVTNDRRSQIPSVNQPAQQQGAASALGPKNAGAGGHGVQSNQVSPCNAGAKAPGQAATTVGGMLKTKCKRERSIGADAGETRNAVGSASETDAKGGECPRVQRSPFQKLTRPLKWKFLSVKPEPGSPASLHRRKGA